MRDSIFKRKLVQLYEFLYEHRRRFVLHKKYSIHILNADKTIQRIRKTSCSIARYGDGEFGHMLGRGNTGFQPASDELSSRLIETLTKRSPNLLICMPICINTYRGMNAKARTYWCEWAKYGQQEAIISLIREYAGNDYVFGDAMVTRLYIDWKSNHRAKRLFNKIKELWNGRDVLIVEGENTCLGIGNDLLSEAKSIERIIAPAVGAFECYNAILETVRKFYKEQLILLALGPTATVLAADLADFGYQALDIGHIDIEYEWYLRGCKDKTAINGKYVNEVLDGHNPDPCDDDVYKSQIVYIVTKD